ncbi:MAG TPA: UMP kinase [Thermotogota bacterium]|nr:UMP kinase [Thermotogota bacterium]HPR95436.1 UMP kinase [Thermotogota bacterium]
MYGRILLKLSGEALSGEGEMGFSKTQMAYLVDEIGEIMEKKVSIGLVVGAGNIFRGAELAELEPKMADQIGMLGTNINAIYLKSFFEKAGMPARVFSQVVQLQSTEKINYDRVNDSIKNGEIVIFGGGTSNPFFTTDTAAALRAVEMGAQIIIKATKVDGIFSADPRKVKDAVKYDTLSYSEAIDKNLRIMDTEAFSICKRYGMTIQVINFFEKGNLLKAVMGEQVGTTVAE